MYTKTINGRQIFSACNTIQTNDGLWVSNPTAEQIAEAGWVEYVPPVIEPEPQLEPEYGDILEAVKKMLSTSTETLSDEDALSVAALFPTWSSVSDGVEVKVGERYWYDGQLYKVIQSHTTQADWTPDVVPALFTVVSLEEWPEIPEVITAESPWMKGDKGTWKGKHYICQMDNCVWNPDTYPAAWSEV